MTHRQGGGGREQRGPSVPAPLLWPPWQPLPLELALLPAPTPPKATGTICRLCWPHPLGSPGAVVCSWEGRTPAQHTRRGGGGWWDERGFQPLPEDHPELKQSRPTLGSTPA